MKHIRVLLSLLLVLSMALSCLVSASAAQLIPDKESVEETAPSALNTGVFSQEFQATNAHKYADTDIVRAIVLLKSVPEADFQGTEVQKSAYRLRLNKEHFAVRKAMKVDFTLAYEFTTLLNGFSCDVAYGDLEAIAKIDGVSAVYIANHYDEPQLEQPENNYANQIIGNLAMNNSGYKGKGIVVAVLDTGLRTTHEAFKVYSSMPITSTLTSSSLSKASVSAKYLSAKVPFAYDYADKDNDVSDQNGHGTHVSGTAVGYAEASDGAVIMSGGAPAAQLVSMKIFKDAGGGTSSDIYFSALEDAYHLGVDVVNMSIGSQNGFTYDSSLESNVFGNIYKRMEQAGIVMCVAAGNEYSMAEFSSVGYIGTEYTDFGTIASPAAYEGNISVAAVQNSNYPTYALTFNGMQFSYIDSCQDGTHGWLQTFGGKTVSVVVLKNADGTDLALGTEADFASVNVKGKIAIVSRGDISFQEKMDNAANAGAVGIIVCNNVSGNFGMTIDPYAIPAVAVNISLKETFLSAASTEKLTTPAEQVFVENASAYEMCNFSNWGPTPMLTIDPTISSIGGMVYSAVPTADNAYEVMSGTSMACPNAAGTFACLLEAIRGAGRATNSSGTRTALTKVQSLERAVALMESTGMILRDADDYIYSVRRQGSGLANSAASANTYFNGAYISNPIQELGDDKNKTGVYTMELSFVNDGYKEVTYDNFNTYILYDRVGRSSTGYVNTLQSGLLYGGTQGNATVTYEAGGQAVTSISLKPSEAKTITVTITLGKDAKTYYDTYFPNGTYVEGFVSFTNTVAEGDTATPSMEVHATFLAFYGDWLKASAVEGISTFEYLQATYALNNEIYQDGKTYAEAGLTLGDVLIQKFGPFYTDMNAIYTTDSDGNANNYLGANLLDMGNTPYSPAYHAISTPNTNGVASDSVGLLIYPHLLRNARAVKMTIKDKNTGTVYATDQASYIPKDRYDSDNESWTAHVGFEWNGTKANGTTYVSSGTVATVSIDIMLPYGESSNQWQDGAITFDVTVDYTAPTITKAVYDASKELVSVTASDTQYLASIILCSSDYQTLHAKQTFAPAAKGESCTAVFDVSGISDKNLVAVVFDYATNQVSKTVVSGTVTTDPTDPTDPTETTEPTEATEPSEPEEPTTDTYRLITSANELTNGEYLIMATATGSYAGNYGYYIMLAKQDTGYAAIQSSGQNFDSLPGGLILDRSSASALVWNFSGNSSGFTIRSAVGTYLTATTGSTSLTLSGAGSTWKGSYNSSKYAFLLTANNRYLALRDDISTTGTNGSPLFVTNNSTDVTVYMHLYKKVVETTCAHSNTTTSTTPATCTKDGETVVTCNDCGAVVSTTVLPATGHSPVSTTTAPTCIVPGKTVETCRSCKLTLSTTTIPATGHSYNAVVTPPTCTAEGYTTYTCTACGDSYVDDYTPATGHKYEYTSQENGTHLVTCTACSVYHTVEDCIMDGNTCGFCGYIVEDTTEAEPFSVTISHSLNLQSDISINYAVPTAALNGYTNFYLECKIPVYKGNTCVDYKTIAIEPILNGGYYYFTMNGVTAVQMNDIIESILYATKDDILYASNVDYYSIATYAYNQLGRDTVPTTLRTLCADLLRYGAKAQIFKEYRTDALADAKMTESYQAFLSDMESVTFGNTNRVLSDLDNAPVAWAGKALDLASKVTLKFVFNPAGYSGEVEDLTLRLTFVGIEGKTKTLILEGAELYNADLGLYAFSFDGLLAAELRTVLSAQIYDGDTPVSCTLEYSADTYGNNKPGALGELCKALFAYSDSAKVFFIS